MGQRRCGTDRALGVLVELAARTGRSVPDVADRLIAQHSRPATAAGGHTRDSGSARG